MSSELFPQITVNGEPIDRDAIAAEAQNHPAPRGRPGDAWRSAARALVVRKLLLYRAATLGWDAAPRDLGGGRRETDEESLARMVLEADIAPEEPTDAYVRAFYDARRERFRTRTLYEASHILFAAESEDAAAGREAAARAVAALETLKEHPKSFRTLAKAESDCPSGASGGRLGQFQTGDMAPEFEAALTDLAPGEVSKAPVRSRFGWHVIQLDERAEGRIPPFEAIAPTVREVVEKARWAQAAHAYLQRLVREAQVEGVSMQDAA